MKVITLVTFLFCASFLFSCRSGTKPASGPTAVSVSITPLKYLVDSIGGGDFEVIVVMPPGSNPETYELSPSQMREIAQTKVSFQVGLIDFEHSLENSLKSNALSANFVNLSEGMELIGGDSGAHRHVGLDPHVWLSPARMRAMAQKIATTLAEIQPDSAKKYTENRDRLISVVDSVDRYIDQSFNELKSPFFLIFHPSLTYYAADYGLQQIPIEKEGKEPSVSHMKALMESVLGKKINTVIYPRAQHLHSTAAALIEEAGLRAVPFDPVAYDWPANMKYITDHIKQSLNE